MGLRPIKRNEDAVGRSSGINGLDRVFNGAAMNRSVFQVHANSEMLYWAVSENNITFKV